jgi:hypothetical protein
MEILKGIKNHRAFLSCFFLIAAFLTCLLLAPGVKTTIQYDSDEGIYLGISSLLNKGFVLYKDIWNDNAPLFSEALAFWLKFFGYHVFAGRVLVMLFSALLLGAFYQTLKLGQGVLIAAAGMVFLMLSNSYSRLSASVMIGLPSLSLAMVALYFLTRFKHSEQKAHLLLSAVFLALALQTKFSAALLIPVFFLDWLMAGREKALNAGSALLWSAVLLTVYFAIALKYFGLDFGLFYRQIFQPHFYKFDLPGTDFTSILKMLLVDLDLALLAVIAVAAAIIKKDRKILLPLSWLLFTFISLIKHRPVWFHYYPLFSVPLTWLAAMGLSNLSKTSYKFSRLLFWLTATALFLIILNIPVKILKSAASLSEQTIRSEQPLLSALGKYKDKTKLVLTDLPMLAFRAGLQPLPELIVFSHKHLAEMKSEGSQNRVVDLIAGHKPEMILEGDLLEFWRSDNPRINEIIRQDYRLVYQDKIITQASWVRWWRTPIWMPNPSAWLIFFLPSLEIAPKEEIYCALGWKKIQFSSVKPVQSSEDIAVKVYLRKDLLKNE